MDAYAVSHLDEIEEHDDGRCPYRAVRHHFRITSFGVTTWTAHAAGDRLINEHDEAGGDEELYLVLRGSAVFEIDGEKVPAPTGTFVSVRPDAKRTAFADEAGTTVIVVGGTPGHAYVASGWELWSPYRALYEAGEYAEIADRVRGVIEAHPEYDELLYNLACCESLAGRKTDAVEHLRLAIKKSERFRDFAKGDSDFEAIRDEPGFKELFGS